MKYHSQAYLILTLRKERAPGNESFIDVTVDRLISATKVRWTVTSARREVREGVTTTIPLSTKNFRKRPNMTGAVNQIERSAIGKGYAVHSQLGPAEAGEVLVPQAPGSLAREEDPALTGKRDAFARALSAIASMPEHAEGFLLRDAMGSRGRSPAVVSAPDRSSLG